MSTRDNDAIEIPGTAKKALTIIAGPCSAETETQVMDIAGQLAATGRVNLFRAGIWKPRTRPGSFEGVGTAGLKWLQQVKEIYNLPCTTEVATAHHVYEALKYGIDTLWIGARTTTNPFAMQELAVALRGSGARVMIKNPVNPDIELWTGAVERVMGAGTGQVTAIHRGFSVYEKQAYRNAPHWNIALELRRRFPGLPLIGDPSHMGGDKKYVYELSLKAIDLGYDGLMVEAHPQPEAAWSDAKQQVTTEELLVLLEQLAVISPVDTKTLPALRSQIDTIDDQLLDMLVQRMHIAEKIGSIKKHTNLAILQSGRWAQVIGRLTGKGLEKGLSSALIEDIFTAIHEESIKKQTSLSTQAQQ